MNSKEDDKSASTIIENTSEEDLKAQRNVLIECMYKVTDILQKLADIGEAETVPHLVSARASLMEKIRRLDADADKSSDGKY